MTPDESYIKLQRHYQHLIELRDQTRQRIRIRNQLEQKFMAAWQLMPDRLRLGAKLCNSIELFRTRDDRLVSGIEHYSFYTGLHDQRIIVTQPYGVSKSDIESDLTLDKGICPEIIDATPWAFYHPGRADLFIIKFPFAFDKAMESFRRNLDRAECEKPIRWNEPPMESRYFVVE
jgi:hypothetical protein